jgi:YesN/AraC family two-component response regulator
MISVIIVDDHPVVRRGMKQIIVAEQDMQVVGEAENAREAIRVIYQTACDAGGAYFACRFGDHCIDCRHITT